MSTPAYVTCEISESKHFSKLLISSPQPQITAMDREESRAYFVHYREVIRTWGGPLFKRAVFNLCEDHKPEKLMSWDELRVLFGNNGVDVKPKKREGSTMSNRTMPVQKPGRSKQDYETPIELIRVIEELQGRPFDVDLAATEENSKAPKYYTPEDDSLSADCSWSLDYRGGMGWLNPEFGMIRAFMEKCSKEGGPDFTIYALVPASIGAAWYREHVYPFATTYALYPRIPFEGWHETAFPKDCILCEYGPDARPTIVEPLEWITNAEARACRTAAQYFDWQAFKKQCKKEGITPEDYAQWVTGA